MKHATTSEFGFNRGAREEGLGVFDKGSGDFLGLGIIFDFCEQFVGSFWSEDEAGVGLQGGGGLSHFGEVRNLLVSVSRGIEKDNKAEKLKGVKHGADHGFMIRVLPPGIFRGGEKDRGVFFLEDRCSEELRPPDNFSTGETGGGAGEVESSLVEAVGGDCLGNHLIGESGPSLEISREFDDDFGIVGGEVAEKGQLGLPLGKEELGGGGKSVIKE